MNVNTNRQIDLSALPFQASQQWDGNTATISADVDEATLSAAVEAAPDAPPPPLLIGERLAAAERATRLTVVEKVRADALTDDDIVAIAPLFPDWVPGLAVAVGEVYRWDGTLVEVIQAHTTQADWTPDVVPALFKIHRTPDMTEWQAGISVTVGEEFTYQGSTYRVVQSHTTQVGWQPPNVPALWALVV